MRTERILDWQVANDDGEWEPIETTERRLTAGRLYTGSESGRSSVHARRILGSDKGRWGRGWVWGMLLVALVVAVGGGYAHLRHRYVRALSQITFQIQSIVDLEARALAQGDHGLRLSQQDAASANWYGQQVAQLNLERPRSDLGLRGCCSLVEEDVDAEPAANVQRVEMRGDVAWVEVVTSPDQERQVRFYRLTDTGWRQTGPRAAFWGTTVEVLAGNVVVRAHKRDLAHIQPLVDHIQRVYGAVCAVLDCPADARLLVAFVPVPDLAAATGDTLMLPSPWLTGIPVDGVWNTAYLDELTSKVTYAATAQLAGSGAVDIRRLPRGGLRRASSHPDQGATDSEAVTSIEEKVREYVIQAIMALLFGVSTHSAG